MLRYVRLFLWGVSSMVEHLFCRQAVVSSSLTLSTNGYVAQWLACLIVNQEVAGSNPAITANMFCSTMCTNVTLKDGVLSMEIDMKSALTVVTILIVCGIYTGVALYIRKKNELYTKSPTFRRLSSYEIETVNILLIGVILALYTLYD